MLNTRLYKILSQLSAPELNRFWKFISSPYFNKNQKITQLIDILINVIKKEKAVPEKEELWPILGFEGEYSDVKFRKLCNDCIDRFERFLINEALESDQLLQSNLLLKSLKKFDIDLLIDKQVSKAATNFNRVIDRSADFYLQKYNYSKLIQSFISNYEIKENIKEYLSDDNYKKLSSLLDIFYVIEKLRQANDMLTWSKQYDIKLDLELDLILNLIENKKSIRIPAVEIYYLIFKILSEESSSDKSYQELKKLSIENIFTFPKREQSEIFDALFSYCIRQINKRKDSFLMEYLELHEWGISENIILKNEMLSLISFRNYVMAGLRIGEYDRVEKYINKNIHLLEKSRRENALNFNLARLAFYKKEFPKVLDYLNEVNYDDVWYNLNSRSYLLVTYYELDELDALESVLESFTVFLRREKSLKADVKTRQLNFVSSLKRLIYIQSDVEKLEKLKERITTEKQMVNKKWLLEKIDELL